MNRFVRGVARAALPVLLAVTLLLCSCQPVSGNGAVDLAPANIPCQNYDGLAELVNTICDEAMVRMQGFFGPTVVEVQPFIAFGQYQENKISSLGVTLADQMFAMVNVDTFARARDRVPKKMVVYKQKMMGSLQEVDGYLRVHISAANVFGERMSYTTSVEMSEPIYRALHTYL